jgi:hypothetical protein
MNWESDTSGAAPVLLRCCGVFAFHGNDLPATPRSHPDCRCNECPHQTSVLNHYDQQTRRAGEMTYFPILLRAGGKVLASPADRQFPVLGSECVYSPSWNRSELRRSNKDAKTYRGDEETRSLDGPGRAKAAIPTKDSAAPSRLLLKH